MKIFSSLFLVVLLISCNQTDTSGSTKVNLGGSIDKVTTYTDDQLEIAEKICNAFQYKRINFPSLYWNDVFTFKVQEQSCSSSKTTTSIIEAQITDQMVWESENQYPFDIAQTDEQGFLSSLCDSIQSGLEISNTKTVGFHQVQQIKFSSDEEYKKFFVIYASMNSAGQYLIDEVYEFSVIIDLPLKGFVPISNHFTICSDGESIEQINSNYLE